MKQETLIDMTLLIKIVILAYVFINVSSCVTLPQKKQEEKKTSAWETKTGLSEGYSPSPIHKTVPPVRDQSRYRVEKPKALPKRPVSLKMSDADLASVLRTLARSVDVNILISEKVTGKINVGVENVAWDEVFKNILKTHGLSYIYENAIIRVMTDEDLMAELNRQKVKQSLEKMEPVITRVVKIDFSDAAAIRESLVAFLGKKQPAVPAPALSPTLSPVQAGKTESPAFDSEQSSISVDTHTNSLIIRATTNEMSKILPVIEALDKPTRQILIKANIVETNQSVARELGAKWGNDGGHFTAGLSLPVANGAFIGYSETHGNNTLTLQLSALQTEGKLKILSSPSITTIDNKKAMIESGKEIPYQSIENGEVQIQYKKAVIHLEVTPHVIDDEMMRLVISTSKDEIDNSVAVNGNPGIITKKAETEVVLFDGNTTVIGGLNKDRGEENRKGIPWLMNLPVIGHLFKWINNANEMEELLIFITPQILEQRNAESSVTHGETRKDEGKDEEKTR